MFRVSSRNWVRCPKDGSAGSSRGFRRGGTSGGLTSTRTRDLHDRTLHPTRSAGRGDGARALPSGECRAAHLGGRPAVRRTARLFEAMTGARRMTPCLRRGILDLHRLLSLQGGGRPGEFGGRLLRAARPGFGPGGGTLPPRRRAARPPGGAGRSRAASPRSRPDAWRLKARAIEPGLPAAEEPRASAVAPASLSGRRGPIRHNKRKVHVRPATGQGIPRLFLRCFNDLQNS